MASSVAAAARYGFAVPTDSITSIDREPDDEASFARVRFKFNFAPVPIGDDPVADNQTQAGPRPDRFRGEKRFEQAPLDLRGNADTVVDNFDDHLAVFQARADAAFPCAIARMNRVVDQISPDL